MFSFFYLKSTKKILYFLVLIIFFCFNIFSAQALKQNNNFSKLSAHQAGELLVKLKNSEQIYKFKFKNDQELNNLIKFYNQQAEVEYAEPNYLYQATLEPLDAYYTQQHYLRQIEAHKAWNITTGSQNVVIAIIDSGVDTNHPDLKDNIWINQQEIPNNGIDDDENGFTDDVNGWDFVDNNNDPKPKLSKNYSEVAIKHGTVVAGIAAAESGHYQGIVGVTWQAKIMPLRVLNSVGTGDTLTVAKAIDYARQKQADIINLSFVGRGKSLTLERAIQKANQAGILIVAAAGNEVSSGINLDEQPEYPVCHDGAEGENWVIGVAAINRRNRLGTFSNYGGKNIDLTAPGVGLFSTVYHNDNDPHFKKYYESGWTGTSVSAPQVAGAAALIKSVNPQLSLKQIKNILLNNADNIDSQNDPQYRNLLGKGRLNVYKAVMQAVYQIPQQPITASKIMVSPAKFAGPHIRVFKETSRQNQFYAFKEDFAGGLNLSSGSKNIVIGLGAGTYPWLKIFNQEGILINQFFAFGENFRGGVEVALGDLNGDGQEEIIVGAGTGGGPQVRIFNQEGILINQFFAFDKQDRSGVKVASTDINQDGKDEIIVLKKINSPEIKIFNFQGKLLNQFTIKNANKKVSLTAGYFNDDKKASIIVGAGKGEEPFVKIFDKNGILINKFLAYNKNFSGGVFVAVGDVDADGQEEIITGAGAGGGPHVRIFDSQGKYKFQFFAYDKKFRGGVKVGTFK